MNTRAKIVSAAALPAGRFTLVTGFFDPLLAWHAERLAAIRSETLVAAVLPLEPAILSQRARAELVAALRVIDYVLIAENGPIGGLDPAETVRLDEEDLRRRGQWIAHVRSR